MVPYQAAENGDVAVALEGKQVDVDGEGELATQWCQLLVQ